MPNVMIFYASVEGHTARIAAHIAARLRERGVSVELRAAGAGAPDFSRYDGVIVGASVHYARHPAHLAALVPGRSDNPTAFFSVSLTAKERYARKFLRRARWQPRLTATFAGALQYSKYGAFKRRVVQAFAWMGGHDIDASRDYEYTDWKAVDAFAAAFAAMVN